MNKISPEKRYRFNDPEDYEARCLRRLREDLGIESGAAEIILQMRRQMITMQARLRQMEDELSMRQAGRSTRLARFRHTYIDTNWFEEPDREV